jgi:hypothetical protein
MVLAAYVLLCSAFLAYMLPWIVASRRGHQSAGGIAVVNVFLGWLGLVWFACLAWACCGPNLRAAK